MGGSFLDCHAGQDSFSKAFGESFSPKLARREAYVSLEGICSGTSATWSTGREQPPGGGPSMPSLCFHRCWQRQQWYVCPSLSPGSRVCPVSAYLPPRTGREDNRPPAWSQTGVERRGQAWRPGISRNSHLSPRGHLGQPFGSTQAPQIAGI